MSAKTDYLWNTYELVNNWISHADAKAAAVLAAVGVFAGFLVTNMEKIVPFIHQSPWYIITSSLLVCILLAASVLLAFLGLLPRLKVGEPKSLIYFNHISQHTVVDYQNLIAPALRNPTKLDSELVYQIWANSKVSTKKFYFVGGAIWCLAFATLFSLAPITNYVSTLLWPITN